MKKNLSFALLAGALLLSLPGCSKQEEAPPVPAPQQTPPAKLAAPSAPVQNRLSSLAWVRPDLDFRNRPDPFKPYAVAAPETPKSRQGAGRPASDLLPIQSFEVTKFKVSGIIAGLRENRALLIDPNGKGYVVQVGMLIGNNDGRITRITANSVEVVESFREDSGRTRKRKIVLTLTKKR